MGYYIEDWICDGDFRDSVSHESFSIWKKIAGRQIMNDNPEVTPEVYAELDF